MSRTDSTSIRIGRDTLDRLKEKKQDESHDELLNRILDHVEDN